MSNVKFGTGYGFVVAETADEAEALYDFITSYREDKNHDKYQSEDLEASAEDMLIAAVNELADAQEVCGVDFSPEIDMIDTVIKNMYRKVNSYLYPQTTVDALYELLETFIR